MTKKKNFEEKLTDLEGVVGQLESGELDLNDSLKIFEKGVKLYRECKDELDSAEKKISKLTDELKIEEV